MNEIGMLRPKRVYKDGKVVKREPIKILDVAGGTGDIAFRIIDK